MTNESPFITSCLLSWPPPPPKLKKSPKKLKKQKHHFVECLLITAFRSTTLTSYLRYDKEVNVVRPKIYALPEVNFLTKLKAFPHYWAIKRKHIFKAREYIIIIFRLLSCQKYTPFPPQPYTDVCKIRCSVYPAKIGTLVNRIFRVHCINYAWIRTSKNV